MTSETTHSYDISMADVVAAGVIGGVITLGIFSQQAIMSAAETASTPQGEAAKKAYLTQIFGMFGGLARFL